MTSAWFGQGLGLLAGVVATLAITHGPAEGARAKPHTQTSRDVATIQAGAHRSSKNYAARSSRVSWGSSPLQCVPFARENSGIELSGNAGTWWDSADGLYQRGAKPQVGSILNFRATRRLRLGHVAVVTNVINSRHIEIDHANWRAPGQISHDIDVVDVSPDNDWTEVRVALGHTDEYGSVYPTFGFIYDRPDSGVMLANTGITPAPMLNAATIPEEVAEAPDDNSVPAPRGYDSRHHASRGKVHAARSHNRAIAAAPSTYRVSYARWRSRKPAQGKQKPPLITRRQGTPGSVKHSPDLP